MSEKSIDQSIIKEQQSIDVYPSTGGYVVVESYDHEWGGRVKVLIDPIHIETLIDHLRFAALDIEEAARDQYASSNNQPVPLPTIKKV